MCLKFKMCLYLPYVFLVPSKCHTGLFFIPATLLLMIPAYVTLPAFLCIWYDWLFSETLQNCNKGSAYSRSVSSDIVSRRRAGRALHQYAYQLQASAWQCALLQTEGALWWRSVSRHQNVWQRAVGPEKKRLKLCIISWVDNSMETLRPTGKTCRDPSQTWPLFSFHCQ